MTDKQKDAVRRIFKAWSDDPQKYCISREFSAKNGVSFKNVEILFSNPTEHGSFYFKVTPLGQKKSFVGIVYSDNVSNNYECISFFKNPKVAKEVLKKIDSLGIMELNKQDYLDETEYPKF